MLLINGTILTMDGPAIADGFVLVRGGKIEKVGEMRHAPRFTAGEEVFDLAGRFLVPGFLDAHTHLGLEENAIGDEGDDINELNDPVTPHLRALDGINPLDRCFQEYREAGITTAVISPGSSNPMGGQICALKTAGKWVDAMAVADPVAIKMALGENPKMLYGDKSQSPSTRMATAAIIRETLHKANKYIQDKQRAVEEDENPPDYDAKYEALIPLLTGKVKAHIHAHRAYDIFTGLRIAKEFGFGYVLVHCTEGHLIADILGEERADAVCGPIMTSRTKPELANLELYNPATLHRAGVRVAICTDHPEVPGRFLLLSAQVAVANGLDEDEALRSITVNPAAMLGLENRVGAIAKGLDADFSVFREHPLRSMAKPELVFCDGVLVGVDNTKH